MEIEALELVDKIKERKAKPVIGNSQVNIHTHNKILMTRMVYNMDVLNFNHCGGKNNQKNFTQTQKFLLFNIFMFYLFNELLLNFTITYIRFLQLILPLLYYS